MKRGNIKQRKIVKEKGRMKKEKGKIKVKVKIMQKAKLN
jgi:hypothetical protein